MLARSVRSPVGMTTDPRQALGMLGETLACEELVRRGYAILERRYRTRHGEIDIIARDGEVIVFVEVKTRAGDGYGDGAEAVTAWKRRRLTKLAMDFLARRRLDDRPCRFDVVAIHRCGSTSSVDVYTHAFDGCS